MNLRNAWYFTAGIGFLALAKTKHALQGYSTPKPFDVSDIERCIKYELRVVDAWLGALSSYTGSGTFLAGKRVLELGPGSDLGVGLILLARGARRYSACDVHDLARHAPQPFYDALLEELGRRDGADVATLREQLLAVTSGTASMLEYAVQDSFDLKAAVGAGTIDLVFSQAAFEHFDDVDAVVGQLSEVCTPGAVLVAEIDLKTHSRWIRDRDPNNIYRYSDSIYDAFRFRGIPNRVRPHEYRQSFEHHGWTRVEVSPLTRLASIDDEIEGLSRRFSDQTNQMDYLSIQLCATRTR